MCGSKKAQQVSHSTYRDWILKTNSALIMTCDFFVFDFSTILETIERLVETINKFLNNKLFLNLTLKKNSFFSNV